MQSISLGRIKPWKFTDVIQYKDFSALYMEKQFNFKNAVFVMIKYNLPQ